MKLQFYLKTSTLQFTRAKYHHEARAITHNRQWPLSSTKLMIVLVVCIHCFLTSQINLQIAIGAVRTIVRQ